MPEEKQTLSEMLKKFLFGIQGKHIKTPRHDTKYSGSSHHNRKASKVRRLMAKRSRRINRKHFR